MSRNKALAVYLFGTFSQLLLVCLVVFFCNHYGVHSVLVNVFGVMIGGISTALWGSIVAICYYEINLKKIIKDFFNIQTSYKHYLLAFFLIILDFSVDSKRINTVNNFVKVCFVHWYITPP